MSKILYVYLEQHEVNGHSIFDKRLIDCLDSDYFETYPYKGLWDFLLNCPFSKFNVVCLSHFSVFNSALFLRLLGKRVFFLNHDLPFEAYFKAGGKDLVKALYFYLKNKVNSILGNHLVITEREANLLALNPRDSVIRVGCKSDCSSINSLLTKKILISGNYKWSLKKRSLEQFLKSYDGRYEIVVDTDCQVVLGLIQKYGFESQENTASDNYDSVYIGLISDDFLSGFKLKSLDLIERGCVIFSFSDFTEEFKECRFYSDFVIYCKDIDTFYSEVERVFSNDFSLQRILAFRQDVHNNFNWVNSAEKLKKALNSN